jgi:hypothetical protein
VSDAFKPEADRLDQEREVTPARSPDDPARTAGSPLSYPDRRSFEVPDADLLEQSQAVYDDLDDEWR